MAMGGGGDELDRAAPLLCCPQADLAPFEARPMAALALSESISPSSGVEMVPIQSQRC